MKTVTFNSKPLTLIGRSLCRHSLAPNFHVMSNDLKIVSLADLEDKIKIITSFPSLDTPVCDLQVKEFNRRATALAKDVVIVGISNDLPFAQKRFCSDNSINHILVFSDYATHSFGINFGVLIKELQLLARTVFILDRHNIVRHIYIVDEITQSPDYNGILMALEDVIKNPAIAVSGNVPYHCVPCDGKTAPLSPDSIAEKMAGLAGWAVYDGKRLVKEIKTKTYADARSLVDAIALIAEEEGHHPVLTLSWNMLRIVLTTHAAGGITDNDFIMASIIDDMCQV